jgi:hypothetical protein
MAERRLSKKEVAMKPDLITAQPPWYQFVGELDWLLNNSDYTRATPTLIGIRETVLATRRVSDGQRRVVDSIRAICGAA